MKFAEALARRAELNAGSPSSWWRANHSARHQEGDDPAEDVPELLAESDRVAEEMQRLIRRIDVTNLAIEVEPGATMTGARMQEVNWSTNWSSEAKRKPGWQSVAEVGGGGARNLLLEPAST